MTVESDALAVLQSIRATIAPGASGWHGTNGRAQALHETAALRELIVAAENGLTIDPDSARGVDASNFLYELVASHLPAHPPRNDSGAREKFANQGQMNAALILAEQDLTP